MAAGHLHSGPRAWYNLVFGLIPQLFREPIRLATTYIMAMEEPRFLNDRTRVFKRISVDYQRTWWSRKAGNFQIINVLTTEIRKSKSNCKNQTRHSTIPQPKDACQETEISSAKSTGPSNVKNAMAKIDSWCYRSTSPTNRKRLSRLLGEGNQE